MTVLLPVWKIGKVFPGEPSEEDIHIIQLPKRAVVSTTKLTVTSSSEQKLLLEITLFKEEIASLKGEQKKSVYEFDVVVSPKWNLFKWLVNIDDTSLEAPKTSIRDGYQSPALENEGAVLHFSTDGAEYSPRNDDEFREVLRSLVSKNSLKFTVTLEKLKAYSSYKSLKDVLVKYGIDAEG